MARELTPLHIADLSTFARTLGRALVERQASKPTPPGHVEMLNLIARAAGHRNVQALKAAPPAQRKPPAPAPTPTTPPPLTDNARKALQLFDEQGRLQRWPTKYTVQRMAMWVLWTRFEAKRSYTEREVNAILRQAHNFGDHATLRRELINHRLMTRKSDCSDYRKLAVRPDEETRALLTTWRARLT